MDGLKRKNSQGRDPEPKNEQSNHCGKERIYSWEKEHSQLQKKQRTITIRIEVPQTQITQQDGQAKQHRGADGSDSAQRSEAQQSQKKPSRSLFQRRGKLDSEDMMKRSKNSLQCSDGCGYAAG